MFWVGTVEEMEDAVRHVLKTIVPEGSDLPRNAVHRVVTVFFPRIISSSFTNLRTGAWSSLVMERLKGQLFS
jgi:hypothetical protein